MFLTGGTTHNKESLMSLISSFNALGLYNVTPSGRYYISMPAGILPPDSMIRALSNQMSRLLTKDEELVLFRSADEYCKEKKRKEKEIEKEVKRKEKEDSRIKYSSDVIDFSLSEGADAYLHSLIPISDGSSKDILFFDPRLKEIIPYDEEKYRAKLFFESRAELLRKAFSGKIEFNPLREQAIYTSNIDGVNYQVFNKCKTPKWFSRTPSRDNIDGSLIQKFLFNLFPDKESLDIALSWAYHAFTSRNQTYLMLIGSQGVGKGMFTSLLEQLVSPEYSEKCTDALLKEKFNSQIKDKRLLVLDEISIESKEVVGKLKSMANNFVPYEAKGKDATTIRNHTSCLLTSNSVGDMSIEPQERRFSAPSIGDRPLAKVMSTEDMNALAKILDTPSNTEPPEEIVNFCHWLLREYKDTKYSNTYVHKGDHFYEMSFNGLANYKQFLINFLLEEYDSDISKFTLSELNSKYKASEGKKNSDTKTTLPPHKYIADFLKTYRYKDTFRLGTLVPFMDNKDNKSLRLQIDPDFKQHLIDESNFIDL
jgi:hypothetical protein